VRAVAALLAPFIPESAGKLWSAFHPGRSVPTAAELATLGTSTLAAGALLAPPGILFPRLELEAELA
jgi:methionyl-tRNA synthetase